MVPIGWAVIALFAGGCFGFLLSAMCSAAKIADLEEAIWLLESRGEPPGGVAGTPGGLAGGPSYRAR